MVGVQKRKIQWAISLFLVMLYFSGLTAQAQYGGGSVNAEFIVGTPTNLGPTVNSSYREAAPDISADGLSLFFTSGRPGGYGQKDLWVTTRKTMDDDWGAPVHLGPVVNSPASDGGPYISADGLALFFHSERPGGYGDADIWVSTRATTNDPWEEPVNLGPVVNSSAGEWGPSISADGLELFFQSGRTGGYGENDLWVATRKTTDDD